MHGSLYDAITLSNTMKSKILFYYILYEIEEKYLNILPHFLVILKSSLCNLLLHGFTLDSTDESSSDSDRLSSCKSEFDKFFLSRVRLS